MKTNIVYVVTEGSYSDYHICAVFDNKEMAEKFIKKYCQNSFRDIAEIEEWEIKNILKVAMGLEWVAYDKEQESFELTEKGRRAYEEYFSNLTIDSGECLLLKNVEAKFKRRIRIEK